MVISFQVCFSCFLSGKNTSETQDLLEYVQKLLEKTSEKKKKTICVSDRCFSGQRSADVFFMVELYDFRMMGHS